MQITSSLVYFLLERKFTVSYPLGVRNGVPVTEPRVFQAGVERGSLFITGAADIPRAAWDGGVFLLCGGAATAAETLLSGAGNGPLPADVACVAGDISPEALLAEVFSLFLALQDWDNRLKDAVFEASGEYTRLFRVAREFFDLPFVLLDRNLFSIAWTDDHRLSGGAGRRSLPVEAPGETLMDGECCRISESIEPYLYPQANEGGRARFLCCNIFRGSHYEGRIAADFDAGKNHPGRSRLLAHICKYIGTVFINTTDFMLARRQSDPLHQLARDLVFGTDGVTGRRALAVLGEIGWQMDDTYLIAVFRIADEICFTQSSLYICRHLETDVLYSCAITYASHIIWLINKKDAEGRNGKRDYGRLITFITREFNCAAGISNPFGNFLELKSAYTEASAALRLGSRRDARRAVYRFADYVLDYILERITSELPAKHLLHPGAVMLWNLDKKDGTGFVSTLRCYMDFQFNMTQAAEKLGLHRTTLIRRLERIGEITGLDFRKPREMLHVALSLELLAESETNERGETDRASLSPGRRDASHTITALSS
ncbi:MAG: helix-turn-helix domain-containing protein [Spirochaetaceae bacterium]|nr:helix-turn-helix domain-containing protein [Spirochaetaceae bacterium]